MYRKLFLYIFYIVYFIHVISIYIYMYINKPVYFISVEVKIRKSIYFMYLHVGSCAKLPVTIQHCLCGALPYIDLDCITMLICLKEMALLSMPMGGWGGYFLCKQENDNVNISLDPPPPHRPNETSLDSVASASDGIPKETYCKQPLWIFVPRPQPEAWINSFVHEI